MKINVINTLLFSAGIALASMGCNSATNTHSDADSTALVDSDSVSSQALAAHADITATKTDTAVTGTAHFTSKGDGTVEMTLSLTIPAKANQTIAVHFHEHPDCSDAGKGAHGHWNPTNEAHGKWGVPPFHSGDIGNIQLDKDGKAEVTIASDRWSIGGDEKTNILNRSIIVHSGVDDLKTQPTGNSGSRIGCGPIVQMN
ncbi:superoxide dismutase family protein [Hufsiella ginkgonis]|uniref:Superoxide dismutase [Cu-Zn] n=1 Tax=Hufsiella ginkgonis TaxID=2695274 RepID=A0A7K1XZJ7_9SPHI|nr:superoxide dismutase family protein [Hufsiella ginkgonis]MXV16228.1 superoxide dismutase family protein [Hufsiella ginkgonis]